PSMVVGLSRPRWRQRKTPIPPPSMVLWVSRGRWQRQRHRIAPRLLVALLLQVHSLSVKRRTPPSLSVISSPPAPWLRRSRVTLQPSPAAWWCPVRYRPRKQLTLLPSRAISSPASAQASPSLRRATPPSLSVTSRSPDHLSPPRAKTSLPSRRWLQFLQALPRT